MSSQTGRRAAAGSRKSARAQARGSVLSGALRLVAAVVLVLSASHARAQTLECATISKGGGVLADGSIVIIGQAFAGTMSKDDYAIEVGVLPCLVPGACVTSADCDDADECTADTCDPGNPEAGSDGCVNNPIQRPFGDVVAPFDWEPDAPTQPDLGDIMCLLADFGDGPPVSGCDGSVYSTDLAPCGGDSVLDLDDILNVLDAFARFFQCPHPCP